LLELVRYIHLNPLRARLVQDIKQLERHQYCGHSVLMAKRKKRLARYGQSFGNVW
jgi:hypothetical protein